MTLKHLLRTAANDNKPMLSTPWRMAAFGLLVFLGYRWAGL